jgi:hypothetical protein
MSIPQRAVGGGRIGRYSGHFLRRVGIRKGFQRSQCGRSMTNFYGWEGLWRPLLDILSGRTVPVLVLVIMVVSSILLEMKVDNNVQCV